MPAVADGLPFNADDKPADSSAVSLPSGDFRVPFVSCSYTVNYTMDPFITPSGSGVQRILLVIHTLRSPSHPL